MEVLQTSALPLGYGSSEADAGLPGARPGRKGAAPLSRPCAGSREAIRLAVAGLTWDRDGKHAEGLRPALVRHLLW